MNPMDYEEFRWALGDTATITLLNTFWDKKHCLDAAHRTAMRDFRLYMLIGGMPQAVKTYIDTKNLQKVDEAKRKIIKLYEDDLLKIDTSGRISMIFKSIPGQLERNVSRYVTTSLVSKVGNDKFTEILKTLQDSKIVNIAYHVNDPNVGMGLTKDIGKFKLFLCDTGLFITLAFWNKDFTENIIYEKLLSDKLSANLGYVYENIVAQMLVAQGNELYYHTWPKDEKHYYEIDFLLSRRNKICPIEIKSSGYNAHASLDAFCKKYSNRILQPYLIYTKDFAKDDQTLLMPVYLTCFL